MTVLFDSIPLQLRSTVGPLAGHPQTLDKVEALTRAGTGDGHKEGAEPRKTLPVPRVKPKRALAGGQFQVTPTFRQMD
jgi:hypothetical protein